MSNKVRPIPEGTPTLTPHLIVKGAAEAIEFYKKAFGAEEIRRLAGPDGKTLMFAEIKVGTSRVYLADEFPQAGCKGPLSLGGTPIFIHMFVEDVDAVFNRAVAAGAQVRMPVADMFWGDRYGQVVDPFGHCWSIATHKEDLTPAQLSERARLAFTSPGGCGQ